MKNFSPAAVRPDRDLVVASLRPLFCIAWDARCSLREAVQDTRVPSTRDDLLNSKYHYASSFDYSGSYAVDNYLRCEIVTETLLTSLAGRFRFHV